MSELDDDTGASAVAASGDLDESTLGGGHESADEASDDVVRDDTGDVVDEVADDSVGEDHDIETGPEELDPFAE
jgi:hypothetical protein